MRICVFCGSNPGHDPAWQVAADAMGRAIAGAGHTLVYGGSRVGLMGAVAEGCLAAGGQVLGVLPQRLLQREHAHLGLTRLEVVDTMHARKTRMYELGDAFVALPGGCGTFEELFEVWTWAQMGEHDKPVALLNVDGFYDHLLAFLDRACHSGFMRKEHRHMLQVEQTPAGVLSRLDGYRAPTVSKWMEG